MTRPRRATRRDVHRLFNIRNRFDSVASRDKLRILSELNTRDVRNSADIRRLHSALCYVRAFPDTLAHFRAAQSLLSRFEDRVQRLPTTVRSELRDTGIAGTPIHYPFSFEVATWMARRTPGAVSIDWGEVEDTSRLDELLEQILLPSEADYFYDGNVSSREWIELASAGTEGSDFDWLLAQLREKRSSSIWSQLYNATDLPLVWQLRDKAPSKSSNTAASRKIRPRGNGMRKPVRATRKEIERRIDSLHRLSSRAGRDLVDIAMASLAVRHRETYHFNYANPGEVYLADVGEGVAIAVFGLQHEHRFPLECTMGYLILANGTPVGYGGSSIVFRQVNTGINIFDEYRGSEASFLWTQVMRVYHQLVGCTRYIANPFQLGSDNSEALQSGAFWFYYRLGYRPVLPEIRKLAQRESGRMHNDKKYRSNLALLRRLASCDMHLTLTRARASERFEERWIATSSMLATRTLAAAGGTTRAEAAERVTAKIVHDLGLRSFAKWSTAERYAYSQLAPIVAAAGPEKWPAHEKESMRHLLRAKGGAFEADYAVLLGNHDRFRSELRRACRRADRGL